MTGRGRWRGFSLLVPLMSLASCGAPDVAAIDGAIEPDARSDAGAITDAPDAHAPSDAGALEAGLDAAHGDAETATDASAELDAGGVVDASDVVDATAFVADVGADAGPADAGPPRPVGAAVDVSGSRCALDSAGSVWCWGRWTPEEDVHLMGAGFDSVSGSCALRGSEVWCAEFTAETMVPVIEGSATLEVNTISEYSDLARGCGHRLTPEGWGEAVCWTDGGSVAREGGTGTTLVAVSATLPREVSAIAGAYEAYDVNPPSTCRSNGARASCIRDTGGSYDASRPAGDHYVLGFGMSCAHNAETTCSTAIAGPPTTYTDDGAFHDQAVSWPIGTWSTVGGVPRYYEARGLCISGNALRCYDDAGVLAYSVDW